MHTGTKRLSAANDESGLPPESIIFGSSHAMAEVRQIIECASGTNVPVLILGESGTGKDVIARMFHERSTLRNNSFVRVNCPAIPGTLLESELFGYEKGAFTGAYAVKPGVVDQANGGTLFLDEISEIELDLQPKILQLLQDGSYMRLGGQETRRADVRLICACNRDLHGDVQTGRFRQDLYYRIAVMTVRLPALRDRIADLPLICDYLVDIYSQRYNARVKSLSSGVINEMSRYRWPGNIRELQNLIRRYVILGSEDSIISEICNSHQQGVTLDIEFDGAVPLHKVTREAVRKLEAKVILRVLKENEWNRRKTARALKISYRALLYKIRDAGLPLGARGKAFDVFPAPGELPSGIE